MRMYLYMLIFSFCSMYANAQTEEKAEWSKREWRSANKARFAWYMSWRAKKSIRYMNLARMYPAKFAKVYREDMGEPNSYVASLLMDLNRQKPLEPLRSTFNLWVSAWIHAKHTGSKGETGHSGFEARMKTVMPFDPYRMSGENCDYGSKDPLRSVLRLLIDADVPSLGHRKNILQKEFTATGASFSRHSSYSYTSVYNFAGAAWWERLFRKRD